MSDETPSKAGKTPVTAEDTVKYLISCIRNSDNGKINFKEVAEECGIVTPGAASKRYDRLLKAHNVEKKKPAAKAGAKGNAATDTDAEPKTPGGKKKTSVKAPTKDDAGTDADTEAKTPSKKTPVSKKRKITEATADEEPEPSIFGNSKEIKDEQEAEV